MRSIIFIMSLLVACPNLASEDGYVFGENHCFYFGAPDGWIADHISGKNQGLPFVFYQKNSTWANATTVVYARVADKVDGLNTPKDQVDRTLKQFRTEYQSPDVRAEKVGTVKAKSGAVGEIYKFQGDKWGNTELVAYFNGKKTINFFVMSSRDAADLKKNQNALEELAHTYREASDCRPCAEKLTAAPCGGPAGAQPTKSNSRLNDLEEQNKRNVATPEGREYEMKAVKAFWSDAHFMRVCVPQDGPITEPLTIFFVVKPDGRMGLLEINPRTEVARCIAKNVGNRRFPEPTDEFVVKIDLKFTKYERPDTWVTK